MTRSAGHAAADPDEEIGRPTKQRSASRRMADVSFTFLFFAVVLVAAIPMGGNRDWAWGPISILLGALAVWQAVGLGVGDGQALRPAEWRPLIVMVLCFLIVVAIGIGQISPITPSSWHSPLYERAASTLGHPVTAMVSINADASRAILIKVVACGAVFVMARAVCRDRRRARLFLILFLGTAVLVAAYGLVMQATNGSCYVFNYSKRPDLAAPGREFRCALSGTFVNSNSYAVYAGMALVTALGLMFSRAPALSEKRDDDPPQSTVAAWFTGARTVYMAIVFLLFGCLLLSESRAGFGSTVLGAVILGILLLRGRWPSRTAVGWTLVAAIILGALFALIAGSAFFHKMSALSDEGLVGRFRIWQVALAAIERSPWLGWGLGSFPDLWYLFQPSDVPIPSTQAHSTPLEWLVEIGIPGALCIFVMVLVPVGVCLRGCLRRRTNRYLPAVAFAAAMVAIVHSTIDFSLQIPAIGFMVSALLGLGWAHAFRRYE